MLHQRIGIRVLGLDLDTESMTSNLKHNHFIKNIMILFSRTFLPLCLENDMGENGKVVKGTNTILIKLMKNTL